MRTSYFIFTFIFFIALYTMYYKPTTLTEILQTEEYKPNEVFTDIIQNKSRHYSTREYKQEQIKHYEENFDKSMINLLQYMRKNNIKLDLYYIVNQPCPSYAFRMNGNDNTDKIILEQLNNPSNQEWRKKKHMETMKYINFNKNAKFYNLYTNDKCDNIDVFHNYTNVYHEQIKGVFYETEPNLVRGSYWFLVEKGPQKKIHFFTQAAAQNETAGVVSRETFFSYVVLKSADNLNKENLTNLLFSLGINF